jgi:predicted RNase H-like HicB family nuclease
MVKSYVEIPVCQAGFSRWLVRETIHQEAPRVTYRLLFYSFRCNSPISIMKVDRFQIYPLFPGGVIAMEKIIKIHLEKLPEGVYLATSDDIQGLVAQGRTVSETIEIARDVARKLIEEQGLPVVNLGTISDSFEYPLIVGS